MDLSLTVSSKIIALLNPLPVRLSNLLGAYELSFPFSGVIHEKSDGQIRALTVESARVLVRSRGGVQTDLGIARSDAGVHLRQGDHPGRIDFTLKLVLQPHQVELLDRQRDGGDLAFTLRIALQGSSSASATHSWPEHAELQFIAPRSDWISLLNATKADHVLLFEVKLPLEAGAAARHPAMKHLVLALDLMRSGKWRQCVAECRQFAEELGGERLMGALRDLEKDPRNLSKDEREAVLVASLRHYAHLAAHSESQQGTMDFDRSDAKLALSLAASLAAHHFGD
jgi:hypothetical protein